MVILWGWVFLTGEVPLYGGGVNRLEKEGGLDDGRVALAHARWDRLGLLEG